MSVRRGSLFMTGSQLVSVGASAGSRRTSGALQAMPGPPDPATPGAWLARADELSAQGRWVEAAQAAEEASQGYPYGSDAWASILLRYCAQLRQQASDDRGARAAIRRVETAYREFGKDPDPPIQTLIDNQLGWLYDEQYGDFAGAEQRFRHLLPEAREAAERRAEIDAHHFCLRTLTEQVMTAGDAWLAASPRRSVPTSLTERLQASLRTDGEAIIALDGENPHQYYRRFVAAALLCDRTALSELRRKERFFAEHGLAHLVALAQARCAVSEGEWPLAIGHASRSQEGYRGVRFPQGIALATAVEAHARLMNGIRNTAAAKQCLDEWILVMLLHPYPTHALWLLATEQLAEARRRLAALDPRALREYEPRGMLDDRVARREGVFQALKYVDVEQVYRPASHLRRFFRPSETAHRSGQWLGEARARPAPGSYDPLDHAV